MQELDAPTYFKHKTLQIINNDLTSIDIEEFDKIRNEVEDGLKDIEKNI